MNSLLSCFFPSTVVVVDDDMDFLRSLESSLDGCPVTFKCFSDPLKALKYVNEENNDELDFAHLIRVSSQSVCSNSVVFDFNKLYNDVFNSNRFSIISTVMLDYAMPSLNGIEFAKKIKNANIRRILFTGVGNEKIAISSFNNGYIHRFFRKDSVGINEEIKKALNQLARGYFEDYTRNLIKFLPENKRIALKDPVFANFFYNTCLDPSYIEYYLLNMSGSYLFLTSEGRVDLLSVLTESNIESLIEVGINSGEISDEVLRSLQSRNYILSWQDNLSRLPVGNWGEYLRPARRLEGYQTYYFSFEKNPKLDVDFSLVENFRKYRSSNPAFILM